jgi:riboflavin-specific deaminase-like protein
MVVPRSVLLLLVLSYPCVLNAFVNRGYRNGEGTRIPLNLIQGNEADAVDGVDERIKGVTLKIAFDSNWGVADMSNEKSERFTCPESLDMVHRLRRCSDAVLVGRTTVERDDCTLTVRRVLPRDNQQPVRVIIDPDRRLELESFQIAKDSLQTLIFHIHPSSKQTTCEEFPNVTFVGLPAKNGKNLSARDICDQLAKEHDIHHVMVEGGPDTARRFLEEGVVDRAILVHAPLCFKEPCPSNLSPSHFEEAGLELVGDDLLGVDRVEFWSRSELPWPANPLSSWP